MGRVAEFLGFGFGQRASEGQQFLAALEPFSFPVEVGVDGPPRGRRRTLCGHAGPPVR